ncbi:MAG: hypothetical protein QW810_00485 [Nitrososphaerota archaeon]
MFEESFEISLEKLSSRPEILSQLAYPSQRSDYAQTILNELKEMDVESIYLTYQPRPTLKFIGKGYRGIVIKARWRSKVIAGKILRTDSGIPSLNREAEMTRIANSIGIGPRVFDYSGHVILMEYIEGRDLDEWLDELPPDKVCILRKVLTAIMAQAGKLDSISLDHGELSNARRHIVVKNDLTPTILDFGKARISRKPKNLTSITSYITRGPHHLKILKMLDVCNLPIHLLRAYKENPSQENFKKILGELNLVDECSQKATLEV